MIQVENLVKRYGGHVAVDGMSFTVEEGKIYGFLGPNGAGKTTTMNVMTGYIAADGGTVASRLRRKPVSGICRKYRHFTPI